MPKWNALVYLLRCSVIFTALLHNIISKTSRTFRAYHADRRCCVSVLIMSDNQVKERRSSIWKSKKSKQRKHWIKKPCAHEKTVKPLTNVTNFIRLLVPSEQNETFAQFHVNRISGRIFDRSKIRPVPSERSLNILILLKVNREKNSNKKNPVTCRIHDSVLETRTRTYNLG